MFVHGFTQTSNSWKAIAEHFAASGYESVVVDLPGPRRQTADGAVDLPQAARHADRRCAAEPCTSATASVEGCVCTPRRCVRSMVRGLALIGASPGIADDTRASGATEG